MTEKLLTIDDVCGILSVTRGNLAQMRYEGRGPRFIKISKKAVRYRESDLDQWIESRVRTSTYDAAIS
jgi:predicted DNA-binding transcriptional regulator AlpA